MVRVGGYVGLTAIIFAETGLLVGFFLPGDSLIVTAGLLSAQPQFGLNVYVLGALLTVAAILGNSLGWVIGRATGPRLFTRDDSLLFKKKHLYRAHEFYERHGGKTLIIARFMPIVRTFVPVVAGLGNMPLKATRPTTCWVRSPGSGPCCSSATSSAGRCPASTSTSSR
jgi:membrane-associated protein